MATTNKNKIQQDEDQKYLRLYNEEAEKAVLCCLIREAGTYYEVCGMLRPEMFYVEKHRKIYSIIDRKHINSSPVDTITIVQDYVKDGSDMMDIVNLADFITSSAHIAEHAAYIKQEFIRRESLSLFRRSCASIMNGDDIDDVISVASAGLSSIEDIFVPTDSLKSIADVARSSISEAEKRVFNFRKGVKNGINTFSRQLDKISGGWQDGDLVIIGARPAMGKCIRLYSRVLTPKGWVLNKDLKIGDPVCSIDGLDSFVTGIYPQGIVNTYEIEFSDGRKIECCKDHLWEVNSSKFSDRTKVLTTSQIKEYLSKSRYRRRMSIPLFCGEFGERKDFVTHPYLLGVLLGDGCLRKGIIWYKPDLFIFEKIKTMIPKSLRISMSDNCNRCPRFSIISDRKENIIKNDFVKLGLYGKLGNSKFIPDIYLTANREQRLQLLNGLLDTNGDVDKLGSICFNSVSEQLAKDVQQLCWSLGYKCSMRQRKSYFNGIRKQDSYRLVIVAQDPHECFSLPRKKERVRVRKNKPLTIISVKPKSKEECQCISVSHPRALYVTDDYIVTHNTALALKTFENASLSGSNPAFFAMEMVGERLVDRLILERTGIESWKYKQGSLTNEELGLITDTTNYLYSLNGYIDDSSTQTVRSIRAKCMRLKRQGKLGIVVIDYLQLTEGDSNDGNRNNEVSKMTRGFKKLAKDLKVPIILLSQVNRASETSGAIRKPRLSDLRDSGSIEQDADMVLFIHRPEYYNEKLFYYNTQEEIENGIEVIIAKYREGETGSIYMKHDGNVRNFKDYERRCQSIPSTPNHYEPRHSQEDDMPF